MDAKNSIVTEQGYYVAQIKTADLAIFSYYVESNKEAILIDPTLDTSLYKDIIAKRHSTLKYVLLSHYHADYLSGHTQFNVPIGSPCQKRSQHLPDSGVQRRRRDCFGTRQGKSGPYSRTHPWEFLLPSRWRMPGPMHFHRRYCFSGRCRETRFGSQKWWVQWRPSSSLIRLHPED